MELELSDWDKDLVAEPDEEYQAFIRTLKFTEGFGLIFVRCSPEPYVYNNFKLISFQFKVKNKTVKPNYNGKILMSRRQF